MRAAAARACRAARALATAALAVALFACAPASQPAPVEVIVVSKERAAKAPPPVVRPQRHVVKSGESLSAIALNYGLDHRELALWNNLRDPNLIKPGQSLRLSAPANAPVVATVKPVKKAPAPAPTSAAASAADKTVIVGDATQAAKPTAAGAATAPYKQTPAAKKYAYSARRLQRLRQQWEAENAAPAPAAAAKAGATASAAAATTKPRPARRRFNLSWSWPADVKMSQKFNQTRKGINFFAKTGDPVYASADGKVVYVGVGVKAYGRLLVIKHDNDYLTAYAHNSKVLVKEGRQVKRGEKVAEIGKTGAQRPMLHFEVRKAGKPIDPLQVLPQQP